MRTMRRKGRRERAWMRLSLRRRGVVSVLSMMFVILFGSLAAAMAIMSRSNLQTAATHQHVMRAMGAAETGLAIAHLRLVESAGRFMVETGTIDETFGKRLWDGTLTSVEYSVLPPVSFASAAMPDSLPLALAMMHEQDQAIVVHAQTGEIEEPTIGPAPAGTDPQEYHLENWVKTPAVAITAQTGAAPRGATRGRGCGTGCATCLF